MRNVRLSMFRGAMMVVLMALATMPLPSVRAGMEGSLQTVSGEVVAVSPDASPPVMVVKALSPKKEAFIVGATIESGTRITRGKQAVSLDAIKVGESVTLTGFKTPNGLVAKSVHVR